MADAPSRLYALVSPSGNLRVRHTVGLPQALDPAGDEPVLLPFARVLVIDQTPDGFFLLRFSAQNEFAGDTWHETLSEAREQAAFEFETLSDWTPVSDPTAAIDELVRELLRADGGGRENEGNERETRGGSMRTKLHQLIAAYVASDIDEIALARDFERAYNFEVDLSALSERERVAFSKLFDILALYSPQEQRVRESYPGCKSEADIRRAVEETFSALK